MIMMGHALKETIKHDAHFKCLDVFVKCTDTEMGTEPGMEAGYSGDMSEAFEKRMLDR